MEKQTASVAPIRPDELVQKYLSFIDQHLDDLVYGNATEMLELNEIAKALHVSHQHLIDLVRTTLGNHPCHFYDQKIIAKAQQLLQTTDWPVAQIAYKLTYDPSNFSKFFKKYVGMTPHQWRVGHRS